MATIGEGQFTYEAREGWGRLPDGYAFKEVAAVGCDADDNVYAFNRGEHPMIVFDKDGNFIESWGEGVFPRAHGVTMAPDGTVFLTDDGDHTVRKCTLNGEILLTLGTSGHPAPFMSGDPFNRCTHVAIDPRNGDFYVSDGYGNARIHKYSPDGRLIFSWGQSGNGPSEFNIAHNIGTDRDGLVYLADRENHRVQVFNPDGRFMGQWNDMSRPCGLYIDQEGRPGVHRRAGFGHRPQLPGHWPRPPGSACTIPKGDARPAWATDPRAKRPGSSSRLMGSAWTPSATSTWARSPGRTPASTWTRRARSVPSKNWSRRFNLHG